MVLLGVAGFAIGWWWPLDSAQPSTTAPITTEDTATPRRQQRKRELLERLLEHYEWDHYQKQSAPLAGLLEIIKDGTGNLEEDIERIVAAGPKPALDQLLTDPIASSILCERIAEKWALLHPAEALRYFSTKEGYRADDCLRAVMEIAYLKEPQLVAEVLRGKSRAWQLYHLEDLFSGAYRVRKPGAPPEPESDSDNPFPPDDSHWITRRFGEDLLDYLADDELRQMARECWTEKKKGDAPAAPASAKDAPVPHWEPESYNPDNSSQLSAFRDAMENHREETLQQIIAGGNLKARKAALGYVGSVGYTHDTKKWMEGLERLEAGMKQLGVIPEYPPSHFEQGPFLSGPEVAGWIDRQPLALRRAWSGTFVETWAQTDAPAALDWAYDLPANTNREQAFQTGLLVWTHRDPVAATSRVESLPPGDLREAAISNAAATWNCIDPAAARKWVESLPDSPGQKRALERLGR